MSTGCPSSGRGGSKRLPSQKALGGKSKGWRVKGEMMPSWKERRVCFSPLSAIPLNAAAPCSGSSRQDSLSQADISMHAGN